MKLIFKPRRAGKTTELIKLCAKEGGYVVCKDTNRCDYIRSLAKQLGLYIPYPLTFHEFVSQEYHSRGVRQLFIDDADDLIRYLSNVPVVAATLTSEES